jgi:hypothetical protein
MDKKPPKPTCPNGDAPIWKAGYSGSGKWVCPGQAMEADKSAPTAAFKAISALKKWVSKNPVK